MTISLSTKEEELIDRLRKAKSYFNKNRTDIKELSALLNRLYKEIEYMVTTPKLPMCIDLLGLNPIIITLEHGKEVSISVITDPIDLAEEKEWIMEEFGRMFEEILTKKTVTKEEYPTGVN